jgi:hypothetical protein
MSVCSAQGKEVRSKRAWLTAPIRRRRQGDTALKGHSRTLRVGRLPSYGTLGAPLGRRPGGLRGQCWPPKVVVIEGHPPTLIPEMSNPHPQPSGEQSLELPVDVLLTRARPLPPKMRW